MLIFIVFEVFQYIEIHIEIPKTCTKIAKPFLALVPPRIDVKELNHPIDPPRAYFTNFGENLKYDKFEGTFQSFLYHFFIIFYFKV